MIAVYPAHIWHARPADQSQNDENRIFEPRLKTKNNLYISDIYAIFISIFNRLAVRQHSENTA